MKRILITGATGFIGGRLAESAVDRGVPAVALVRSWSSAARLARLPVHMVPGDVLDLPSLRQAMTGCDAVVHCAVDGRARGRAHRQASEAGTRNVMQAALEAGVRRVVHLSSAAVHGYNPSPDAATEEGPYRHSRDDYCEGKIAAEKVALRYHRELGLPVTILRPAIVYGPFGVESVETASLIRGGKMVLVNGGTGVCNSLHVDNLIDAVWLALEVDRAVGEVFHVSDGRPVTWREFIEPHARAIDRTQLPLRTMSVEEIAAARKRASRKPSSFSQLRRALRSPVVRRELRSVPAIRTMARGARVLSSGLPWHRPGREPDVPVEGAPSRAGAMSAPVSSLPPAGKVEVYSNQVTFSIAKARTILGYEPRIPFSQGIDQTIAWVQWARL
jgi:nucleoside-diphosphate-sugar epimerase